MSGCGRGTWNVAVPNNTFHCGNGLWSFYREKKKSLNQDILEVRWWGHQKGYSGVEVEPANLLSGLLPKGLTDLMFTLMLGQRGGL